MADFSKDFKAIKDKIDHPDTNVSQEFQIFGCELAESLHDLSHKSLYIKLAKDLPRNFLMQALQFVADYPNARSKGKLFMFKLKQLQSQHE